LVQRGKMAGTSVHPLFKDPSRGSLTPRAVACLVGFFKAAKYVRTLVSARTLTALWPGAQQS
jgi:hypothetical protein